MLKKKMRRTSLSLIPEMDQSVRRMLKLIEEDGDSFAKKAEMYYQKRPELISLVEEFYRMYLSLAERYDHVTGELRKNIPSDLQSLAERYDHVTGELRKNIPSDLRSQGSGISDVTSETSTRPSPAPEQRLSHRRSGHRAAGFEFFLGSGGSNSDLLREGDDASTLTDSGSESDDSSVNNYTGLLGNSGDNALSRKIINLEMELREMKERLQVQQEGNGDGALREMRNDNFEDLLVRIPGYDLELKTANQRLQESEEEIARLKIDLQKYKSLVSSKSFQTDENVKTGTDGLESENIDRVEAETEESNGKIQALAEELRITKEKLQYAEKEIAGLHHQLASDGPSERISSLQEQLALAHKDINMWKTKHNAEKREVSKLQERIARLKTSLSDRDHEIRDLKTAVSDAEEKIFPEKAQIKAEIAKLLEERTSLQEQVRESESHSRSLEDEIRILKAEMSEREERHNSKVNQLKGEIAERDDCIKNLNKSIDALMLEKNEANAQVISLKADVTCKDNRIDEMEKHLQQLHVEHAELIAGAEEARKLVDKLRSKAEDLEKEVERQRIVIQEGAEEKREAIRQLCFSLEHYRNGYLRLREAFIGHKRVPVLAA